MLNNFGIKVTHFLDTLGGITRLSKRFFENIFSTYHLLPKCVDQIYSLGIKSLLITIITSSFIGLAFTLQIVREFQKFGANYMIGGIVGLAMWRELAPLLTGVAISARIGAAITSEIGSMKVTEQIDALKALSQDPIKYLVVPRVLAVTFMMPLLVALADAVGFLSGYLIAIPIGNINPYAYFKSATIMLSHFDIIGGLIKAIVFGFLIGLISCYKGLNAKSGAKGVGKATTQAVVTNLICIFISNYFLSFILF
ncbi:ABC transporter permease [Candidatus Marinamargulisbacteria bacterium SCGC AG-343-D04]|nr:ABC transporter permease [Candidatus Marinamargulisbacteria bacterium SCGC AG-343-D04]